MHTLAKHPAKDLFRELWRIFMAVSEAGEALNFSRKDQ